MQRSRINLSVLRAVACVVVIAVLACLSLTACDLFGGSNHNTQQTTPSSTPDEEPEVEEPSGDEQPEEQPDVQEPPEDQKQPDVQEQPSEEEEPELTREEFESELAIIIENYYNENISLIQSLNISETKILTINAKDSRVYFSCMKTEKNGFGVVTINSTFALNSYRQILENLNLSKQDFVTISSRIMEQGVPEDICAFALSQSKVTQALYSAGVSTDDIINYKVINTTEFQLTSNGNVTNITMIIGDKIVTVSMGGSTGWCKSQREYLTQLQKGYFSYLENIEIKDYSELALSDGN